MARSEELSALLSAYLDEHVSAEEQARVEQLLRESAEARELLRELEQVSTLVAGLPRHAAPASLADDLQLQLERAELLGEPDVVPLARGQRRSNWRTGLAVAAMLVIVVGGTLLVSPWGPWGQSLQQTQLAVHAEGEKGAPIPSPAINGPRDGGATAAALQMERGRRGAEPSPAGASLAGVDRVGDRRTFNEKLAAGVALQELAETHDFAAEPLQVQLTVADAGAGRELLRRLEATCGARGVADLRKQLAAGPVPETAAAQATFYLPGDKADIGKGPSSARRQRVLLRVPAETAREVFAELQADAPAQTQLEMQVGQAITVRDWSRAQQLLALAGEGDITTEAAPTPTRKLAVARRSGERSAVGGGDPLETFVAQMRAAWAAQQEADEAQAGPDSDTEAETLADATEAKAAPSASKAKSEPSVPGEAVAEAPPAPAPAASAEEEGGSLEDEGPSLVEKRLEAARARRAKRSAAEPLAAMQPAAEAKPLAAVSPPLVLVIEIVVPEPADASPAATPPPAADKPATKRPPANGDRPAIPPSTRPPAEPTSDAHSQ